MQDWQIGHNMQQLELMERVDGQHSSAWLAGIGINQETQLRDEFQAAYEQAYDRVKCPALTGEGLQQLKETVKQEVIEQWQKDGRQADLEKLDIS